MYKTVQDLSSTLPSRLTTTSVLLLYMSLQRLSLARSVHVRSEHPLVVRFTHLHRTELDLIQLQLEARSKFYELNVLALASIYMVSVVSQSQFIQFQVEDLLARTGMK